MLLFEEREKPGYPEKNILQQSREPTNSTHIIIMMRIIRGTEPRPHRWEASAVTTVTSHQPCSRYWIRYWVKCNESRYLEKRNIFSLVFLGYTPHSVQFFLACSWVNVIFSILVSMTGKAVSNTQF